MYLLCISLCIWYIVVLYWIWHPNPPSIEYDLYYIENKLIDWSGYRGLKYKLGNKLFFGTNDNKMRKIKHRGKGWSYKEKTGNWTKGNKAYLYFTINEEVPTNLQMSIYANAFAPEGNQVVDVIFNDKKIGVLNMKHSKLKKYNVKIPNEVVKEDHFNQIEFVIHKPNSPYQYGLSDDKRLLGMRVRWLELDLLQR